MSDRPPVSVVMPFAGDGQDALCAISILLGLQTRPGDQLILADNSEIVRPHNGIAVVIATGEHSPAHARNAGAERAEGEWILFLDADCRAPRSLIDDYFSTPIDARVGALAGEVDPANEEHTLAARYGAARGFLGQRRHLAHPYLPRAVAANLLVRREAFEQVGGFFEGLRAAEDTDFSWRLQQAGWRLELRPEARVEHRYRTTLSELRRQWRGYAAGRAWLARRYEDFAPQPAVARAARRLRGRLGSPVSRSRGSDTGPRAASPAQGGPVERGRYLAIDALLAGEELAGFVLSNRPSDALSHNGPARVVLVAERFPALGDPLIDFARALAGARVEAFARPETVATGASRDLTINYREDDGGMLRGLSAARLFLRHPICCLLDVVGREPGDAPLSALAPAVRRLQREPAARVHPLGGGQAQVVARRMAALAGRPLDKDS